MATNMTARVLDREEYIEQAYFFRIYRERLDDQIASQDILSSIQDEVLATTKLPIAIEVLRGEMLHSGRLSSGMAHLGHYFTQFQTFIMSKADDDTSGFDQRQALLVLEREADYRSQQPSAAGLFIYEFECIARNRLGYDKGLTAITADPLFNDTWRDWIAKIKVQLGSTEFAALVYARSQHAVTERVRRGRAVSAEAEARVLFGEQEGRIAKANLGKDPLYMFSALQRQLGYPAVPRPIVKQLGPIIHPALEQRLQRIEQRMQLMEAEIKGDFDLSKFYKKPGE